MPSVTSIVGGMVSRAKSGGSEVPRHDEPITPLEQFRRDFKFVLKRMHDLGQMSQVELEEEYRIESDAIRRHSHDEAWMRAAAAHFREMAERFERDIARSERIKSERREERRLAADALVAPSVDGDSRRSSRRDSHGNVAGRSRDVSGMQSGLECAT